MKILLKISVVQFLALIVFAWFNRVAWMADSRAQTAAGRIQAQVEEANAEKWENIEARAGLEPEKGIYSNWATPQGSKAISDFGGQRDKPCHGSWKD